MLLLRNLYIWMICSVLIIGGIFLFISGSIFYTDLEQQVLSSYAQKMSILSPVLSEIEGRKPGTKELDPFIKAFSKSKTTYFARIVDTKTGRILASTDKQEEGDFYENWTSFNEGDITVQKKEQMNGQKIISLNLKKENGLAVWMAINETYLIKTTLIYLIKQSILIILTALLLFTLFYLLERKYLLRPMRELRDTMKELGEDKFVYSEKDIPKSFGGLLSSFNSISQDIKSVLKHEKKSTEIKTEFISTTAHQLRTPLSGINWALESLKADPNDNLTNSQKKLVNRAHKKIQELIKMVKSLLMTSSLEKGQLGFHYENFDIVELAQDIIEEEKKNAKETGVELKLEYKESDIPKIRGDKERIKWVFRNLIENGIRYTGSGKIIIVKIKFNKEEKDILVSVTDNGIGISEKDRSHIFEKFYRSERAIQKHNEGNGLGLFIVKKIIEHHKGKIWFETEKEEGTTFYFTLPI